MRKTESQNEKGKEPLRELFLTIPGRLEGLNEYTKANRTSAIIGAEMKLIQEYKITQHIDVQILNMKKKFKPLAKVEIKFKWYEPNMKRDPDNVAFAKKFILDALVKSGVIASDGWKTIRRFSDDLYLSKERPRVEVIISEVDE